MPDQSGRPVVAAVLAVVLTCDLGLLIGGSHRWQGPTIVEITYNHGIHATDPLLVVLWAGALAWCWWWARSTAP